MNSAHKRVEPPAPRSQAAIELLEQMQLRAGRKSGDERRPENDVIRVHEIARGQVMKDYLDSQPPMSIEQMSEALTELVGTSEYSSRVEARVANIAQYISESDGDQWSRYERPDRRRRLSELVVRVEKGASECEFEIPRRPVVGTLPTYDVNAQAIPGPPEEGHLIMFDSGVFSYSLLLARVAGQAIDAKPSADGKSLKWDPGRLYQQPGYDYALLRQWTDLLFSQAILRSSVYCELIGVSAEHLPFADQLREAIDTFTLAHEYGHVIEKHTDLCGSRRTIRQEEAHAQEFAADRVAFEICTAWGGSLWACLGATVFFYGREGTELASNAFLNGEARGKPSPTHPSPAARREAIIGLSAANPQALQMSRAIYEALGKMTGFILPAFVRAHRDGYPETGYRPASEYEKMAALESFWQICLTLQTNQQKG